MNAPESEAEEARARALEPPHPDVVDESGWEKIAANLKTIGGAVILALIIRTCLFEAFEIEGPSMEPTLLTGDRVVVVAHAGALTLALGGLVDGDVGAWRRAMATNISSPRSVCTTIIEAIAVTAKPAKLPRR